MSTDSSTGRGWLRARRLRKWEDRLADHQEHLDQWAFGMRPSARRREQEQIDKARVMVARLSAPRPSVEGTPDRTREERP